MWSLGLAMAQAPCWDVAASLTCIHMPLQNPINLTLTALVSACSPCRRRLATSGRPAGLKLCPSSSPAQLSPSPHQPSPHVPLSLTHHCWQPSCSLHSLQFSQHHPPYQPYFTPTTRPAVAPPLAPCQQPTPPPSCCQSGSAGTAQLVLQDHQLRYVRVPCHPDSQHD